MFRFILVLGVFGLAAATPAIVRSREEIQAFRSYLEGTKSEHGTTLEQRMAANPKAKVWENSGRYEGDIILDDMQTDGLLQSYGTRKAFITPNTKWPDNTVVYEFAADVFDDDQRSAIMAAIDEIEENTCIRFRERNDEDTNYVLITGNSDGCYAHIGYWSTRGVHDFNLALDRPGFGCFLHTIIIHEWLHIIGFWHMQATYNRDEYVEIFWDNIQSGEEHNFERQSSEVVSNLDVPYEYASTMHYEPYAFSKNGEPTISAYFDDNNLMGQQEFVTRWDWLRANRHYDCPGAWSQAV